jgi:hypothetical protein
VAIAVRTLADPADPADLVAMAALQDRLAVTARSAKPFTYPAWDPDSLVAWIGYVSLRHTGPACTRSGG